VGINKKFQEEHNENLDICRGNNALAVCDYHCVQSHLRCFDNKCIMSDKKIDK
jgi:hypothetical protein